MQCPVSSVALLSHSRPCQEASPGGSASPGASPGGSATSRALEGAGGQVPAPPEPRNLFPRAHRSRAAAQRGVLWSHVHLHEAAARCTPCAGSQRLSLQVPLLSQRLSSAHGRLFLTLWGLASPGHLDGADTEPVEPCPHREDRLMGWARPRGAGAEVTCTTGARQAGRAGGAPATSPPCPGPLGPRGHPWVGAQTAAAHDSAQQWGDPGATCCHRLAVTQCQLSEALSSGPGRHRWPVPDAPSGLQRRGPRPTPRLQGCTVSASHGLGVTVLHRGWLLVTAWPSQDAHLGAFSVHQGCTRDVCQATGRAAFFPWTFTPSRAHFCPRPQAAGDSGPGTASPPRLRTLALLPGPASCMGLHWVTRPSLLRGPPLGDQCPA